MTLPSQPSRRRGAELEFLPAALEVLETPPHPAARATALTISAFLLGAIAWACLGFIDTVAVAEGQIVPSDRVKLIQPLETGIVRAILVQDGQRVATGDALIALDPTDATTNAEALRADLMTARLDAAVAAALLTDDPVARFAPPQGAMGLLLEAARAQLAGEVEKLRSARASVTADIEEQTAALLDYQSRLVRAKDTAPLVEDRLTGLEDLHKKNLVRKPDLYATRQQRIEILSDIQVAESGIAQVKARVASRQNKIVEIEASARAAALDKRADALRRIATLEQQVIKEAQRQTDRTLRAPVAGTVVELTAHTIGGVATTKDVLMKIVPDGAGTGADTPNAGSSLPVASALELECFVANQDVGFVSVGQAVEIKLETFPFTRYGLIPGTVTRVSRDAIADEKRGLVYKATVRLEADRILVGDAWVPLAPGMAAQADIKTGKRRLITYFLSPFLRYRNDALRER